MILIKKKMKDNKLKIAIVQLDRSYRKNIKEDKSSGMDE